MPIRIKPPHIRVAVCLEERAKMRTAASRLPKNFDLYARLDSCGIYVEKHPEQWKNRWHMRATHAPFDKVVLDLGCGKGEAVIERAHKAPNTLFIGVDIDGVCIVRSGERAQASGFSNVVFIYQQDVSLCDMFAPGELDGIILDFPTPFPKKKKASLRLTHLDHLLVYRRLLKFGASIRLRTDSVPLRDFSLTQLALAGYELVWSSNDVRSLYPDEPISAYEQKTRTLGACICGFEACPDPAWVAPVPLVQTAALSLVSYLPENIEDMPYMPHGMQGCIENMKGRRANDRKKGRKVWTPSKV